MMNKENIDDDVINKAEKMLVGMTLITENIDDVISSDMTDREQKKKLKILARHCENFLNMFWKNLGPDAEKEFFDLITKREVLIDKYPILKLIDDDRQS